MMMLAVPRCLYQIEILQAELAAIRAEPSAREACAIDNQRPVEEVDLTAVDECSLWAQWQWVKGNGATATGKRGNGDGDNRSINCNEALGHWAGAVVQEQQEQWGKGMGQRQRRSIIAIAIDQLCGCGGPWGAGVGDFYSIRLFEKFII
jgi:hypothetical protein